MKFYQAIALKSFKKFALISALGWLSLNTLGQTSDTTKMSSLMVYGNNFMFSVKEPENWVGDINNANQFHANIIFYKNKKDFESGGPLIQLYIFQKQDEKTQNDLQYDIGGYQKDYKNLKQKNFEATHKEYKCFSKLVYVDNNFYQYIAYLNCGVKFKSGISVAMNISKRPATEDELNAFLKIIASLIMFKG